MARTGFPSRFLLGDRGLPPGGRLVLNAFLGMLGVGVVLAGLVAGSKAFCEVVDPNSELHRLHRPLSARERAAGLVRQTAVVSAATPEFGLCRIEHQHYVSGKNGGWRTDYTAHEYRQASLLLDGVPHTLAPYGDALRFVPARSFGVDAGRVTQQLPDVVEQFPRGGRLRAQCAEANTPVFVEGCLVQPGLLGRCPAGLLGAEAAPVTLTLGDGGNGQPRVDRAANRTIAQFSGAALGLLLTMAWLWFVLRARPVVDALLRRVDGPKEAPPRHWELALLVPPIALVMAQGVAVWGTPPYASWSVFQGGYTFAAAVSCGALLLAASVWRRRLRLDRAMWPILDAPTVSIREARGGVVELCATVSPDAPTVLGPISRAPRAWLWIAVWETCYVGKQTFTTRAVVHARPRTFPVRDASGEGEVDPDGVEPDLRAVVRWFKHGQEPELTKRLLTEFGIELRPSGTHVRWMVEEGYLERGEPLYLLGSCQRVDDPKAVASYRGDATRPVVRGGDGALILHAGDEGSLLGILRRERRWLDLLGAALVGVSVSLLGLSLVLLAK